MSKCLLFTYLSSKLLIMKWGLVTNFQGGRGNWGVYYTSHTVLLKGFLIRWLNNFGDFSLILIGWFINLSVQTFQPLIIIYRRDNFVYHYWEYINSSSIVLSLKISCKCTSIIYLISCKYDDISDRLDNFYTFLFSTKIWIANIIANSK